MNEKIKRASRLIEKGLSFQEVMEMVQLTKEELILANNSIPSFDKISKVIVSDGTVHPKGMVLAW